LAVFFVIEPSEVIEIILKAEVKQAPEALIARSLDNCKLFLK